MTWGHNHRWSIDSGFRLRCRRQPFNEHVSEDADTTPILSKPHSYVTYRDTRTLSLHNIILGVQKDGHHRRKAASVVKM